MRQRLPIPLAWLNLTHDRRQFALFSLGIAFAVVLMFVQYGFRNALLDSNVLLIERLNADLMLVSRQESCLAFRESFPRRRLVQVAGVAGVRSVYPLYIEYHLSTLRNPSEQPESRPPNRPIRVLGVDPEAYLLNFPELDPAPDASCSHVKELKRFGCALFDRRSKTNPANRSKSVFGEVVPGVNTDLAGRGIKVVGGVDLGSDFGAEGTMIVNLDTFAELLRRPYCQGDPLSEVEIGLIRLETGADRKAVQNAIRASLTEEDVDVLTRDEFMEREKRFWLENTPIGFVFGFGMFIGFGVGMVICYQILSSDVADHVAEYATLKALGYTNRYLSMVVIQQALLMAVAGFLPGLCLSWIIYRFLEYITALPMRLSVDRVGFLFGLTVLMCAGSGLLAVRKAQNVDPAEVF